MRLGIDLDGVVADFNAGWMDRYNEDFDAELIDALMALESDNDDDTLFDDDPEIEAEVISFRDLRVMERLLEPYVDFRSLAANA